MKILILGASGLLGNNLYRYFHSLAPHQVFGTIRNQSDLYLFSRELRNNLFLLKDVFDIEQLNFLFKDFGSSVIINCIASRGLGHADALGILNTYSIFPKMLKNILRNSDSRLIHFSSDGVFSGLKGFYSEEDTPDPIDIYGVSKYLGEIDGMNILTIRTSIIGDDIKRKTGLLNWVISHNGGVVNGYTNQIFSGLSAIEIGKVIWSVVMPNSQLFGLFNVAGNAISKHELILRIAKEFNLEIVINPKIADSINRSLDFHKFHSQTGYLPPAWDLMMSELHNFNYGLNDEF